MKILLFIIGIHFLAFSVARGNDQIETSESSSEIPVNRCISELPTVEQQLKDLDLQFRNASEQTRSLTDLYIRSFNQMTDFLFQMTLKVEKDAQDLSQGRGRLKESVDRFNSEKNGIASKQLQDNYLDLTMRVYASLMDGQRSLETLKTQLQQVEAHRGQLEQSKKEADSLDQARLELESKYVSLKIKCQKSIL